jgi:hypothetical protein
MKPQSDKARIEPTREAITAAAVDELLKECRRDLARFASRQFLEVGSELHVLGHLLGPDRKDSASPFGHGDDETVAISLLLRIASQLISASSDLFTDGRHYAAAALLRQIVEIEYLAWAFETRDGDGRKWLRSTEQERQDFFKPAKLRAAAQGKFRGKDYGYHCEFGGHPVPKASILSTADEAVAQVLLSDLLGHVGRIWDHLVGWAIQESKGAPILSRAMEMSARFGDWKQKDVLVDLPPPP